MVKHPESGLLRPTSRRNHDPNQARPGPTPSPSTPATSLPLRGIKQLRRVWHWLSPKWPWLAGIAALGLLAVGYQLSRPLPPPTPGLHPLVVVTHSGPLTYDKDGDNPPSGFEHDLVLEFAKEQGLEVQFLPVAPQEISTYLLSGKAHLAAAWLTHADGSNLKASIPFMATEDIVVQNEAALPMDQLKKLRDKTIHVVSGSRQATNLQGMAEEIPGLKIAYFAKGGELELLQAVARGDVELALIDRALLKIALNYYPNLQTGVVVGKPSPITWLFPATAPGELLENAEAFFKKSRKNGLLKRLEDRYLGNATRLTQGDVVRFITSIETILPKYRKLFQAAQMASGLDWRLIAAVAYQESQWDPLATSPTGVRGMMMLTEETADRLGVKNRLDPNEAIPAGARYLSYLRTALTATAPDPDSYWLALAAYNIGPGHFNAARRIARQVKKNPDSWYEMKEVLPLLAQPQYYESLISGRGRGGEAVIMAENVRMFFGILSHHEAPLVANNTMLGMIGMGGMFGMSGMNGMEAAPAPNLKPGATKPQPQGSPPGLKANGNAGLQSGGGNNAGLKLGP